MENKICYNCGKELENKDVTREHIPSRNLFEGYDEKFKVNRITVSVCFLTKINLYSFAKSLVML